MMRVYYFVNAEFGIKDLREQRLKVSRFNSLNDPFEFGSARPPGKILRSAWRKTWDETGSNIGLLCFSKHWHSPVMWGHYADSHRGLCLGFEVPEKSLQQVQYVASRCPWPEKVDIDFMKAQSCTKFSHWSYEDEFRMWIELGEGSEGLHYAEFDDALKLRSVLVGARCPLTRADIDDAMKDLPYADEVERYKVRPAFRDFRIVRQKNETYWT